MFRVREVVFDENLDEVSYVIEGTLEEEAHILLD